MQSRLDSTMREKQGGRILAQKNELPTPRSPISDSAASEPETFEQQQQARYEREF